MQVSIQYEKQGTYRGVFYLHGWYNPTGEFSWLHSRWFNLCLRRYDAELPLLFPGDSISVEGEYLSGCGGCNNDFFNDFIVQKIDVKARADGLEVL